MKNKNSKDLTKTQTLSLPTENVVFRNLKTHKNYSKIILWLLASLVLWVALLTGFKVNGGDFSKIIDARLEALLPAEPEHNQDSDRYMDRLGKEIIMMISWQGGDEARLALVDKLSTQAEEMVISVSDHRLKPLFKAHGILLSHNIAKFVWEHRYSFTPPSLVGPEALVPGKAQQALKDNALNALYNPFIGISAEELKHDPFMTVRTAIASLSDGYTMSQAGFPIKNTALGWHHQVVRLSLARDPTPSESANLLAQAEKWRHLCKTNMQCVYTGPLFFAQSSEQASKDDMFRIGIASTIVLFLLYAVVFRGWRELILTLVMLAGALVTGVLAVLAVFGSIHAIALGMGGTLCGICADYAIHVFTHQKPGLSSVRLMRRLNKPLLGSLVTSILAYLVLALSGLTVLSELAVLAVAALLYSWLSVYLVFTSLAGNGPRSEIVGKWFLCYLNKCPNPLRLLIACMVAVIGITLCLKTVPDDDCASMQSRNGTLTAMNEAVMSVIGGGPVSSFYLILGQDTQEALARCSDLAAKVEFKEAFMPCRLLPTKALQQERFDLYLSLFPLLEFTYAQEGITLNKKDAGLESLRYFTPDEFPGELSGFVGERSVLVRVAKDSKAEEILQSLSYVELFDRRSTWNQALGQMRVALSQAFPWAFLGVILIGFVLLKKRVFSCMAVPLLAGIGAGLIGVYVGANGYYSLFTALALFMLLGLGADYCIFLGKSDDKRLATRSTSGVLLAFATTEVAFGALAFSDTAVISAFGLVLAFGLPVIILAVPIVLKSRDLQG